MQQSNEKCECTSVADGVPFPISPKKTETKSSVNPVLVKIKINVEILNNPVEMLHHATRVALVKVIDILIPDAQEDTSCIQDNFYELHMHITGHELKQSRNETN